MMNSIERKIIADGVAFNNIKVNRFKTIRMSINLYVPLNVEDAAHNALCVDCLHAHARLTLILLNSAKSSALFTEQILYQA